MGVKKAKKGGLMKIYNLTIMFNPKTDEIEFIEETVDDLSDDNEISLIINDIDITESFDNATLKLLVDANEVGIS